MASPFPGMNPYLEQDAVWHDFHERFCPAAAEMLTAQLRPHYIVKIDEHVYIHEMPDERRRLVGRADVGVADLGTVSAVAPVAAPALASVEVRLPVVDFVHHSFLEIRDRADHRLVTVIELLSPSNKAPGPDREQYLAKRAQVLASAAHFVELDLLRGGPRMPMEGLPACAYCVLVSRVEERPMGQTLPIGLRDPLPVVPIPLRDAQASARLDLKALVDRIHDGAGYEDYIYDKPPQPALSAADLEWARAYLPAVKT